MGPFQRYSFTLLLPTAITISQYRELSRQLAIYFLLLRSRATALPQPQEEVPVPEGEAVVDPLAPVTSVATVDGSAIAATFTPTSLEISGLQPPVTAATTVTTTDSEGKTIAIAVAAGAGVVAGGALAAWLFEPIPGAPPPPTSPPPYPTSTQEAQDPDTLTDQPTTTSPASSASSDAACPFQTEGTGVKFEPAPVQAQWTAVIPEQSASSNTANCTSGNDNGQLYHGVPPDFISELADVFCSNDLSADLEKSLGKDDLPDGSSWKREDGYTEPVKFTFDLKAEMDGCAEHCKTAYSKLVGSCKYG